MAREGDNVEEAVAELVRPQGTRPCRSDTELCNDHNRYEHMALADVIGWNKMINWWQHLLCEQWRGLTHVVLRQHPISSPVTWSANVTKFDERREELGGLARPIAWKLWLLEAAQRLRPR